MSNRPPYINDWCCIAGGGCTGMVIDTIFGVYLPLFEGLKSSTQIKRVLTQMPDS